MTPPESAVVFAPRLFGNGYDVLDRAALNQYIGSITLSVADEDQPWQCSAPISKGFGSLHKAMIAFRTWAWENRGELARRREAGRKAMQGVADAA